MLKLSRKTTEIDFWPESLDIANFEVTRLLIIIISHSIYQRRLVFGINVTVHEVATACFCEDFFLFSIYSIHFTALHAFSIDISNSTRIDGIFHMVNIDRHTFLPFSTEKLQLANHKIEFAKC